MDFDRYWLKYRTKKLTNIMGKIEFLFITVGVNFVLAKNVKYMTSTHYTPRRYFTHPA